MLRIFVCLALTLPFAARAQQIGQNKVADAPEGTTTISVKSQLVVETVVVKDKHGKFIPGLTAGDFALTEDGAPETLLEARSLPKPRATSGTKTIACSRSTSTCRR